MKPGSIEFNLKLDVSDDTAATCAAVLNYYLKNHPEVDVNVCTARGYDDILTREIHLKHIEATP